MSIVSALYKFSIVALVTGLIPLSALAHTFYLPHYLDGAGFSMLFSLSNPGAVAATGTITFFDAEGSPQALPLGTGQRSQVSVTVPPSGTMIITTMGTSNPAISGWALVDVDQDAVSGVAILRGAGFEATVLPTVAGRKFALFAEHSTLLDTGIAIVKQTISDPTNMTLYDLAGSVVATATHSFRVKDARFLGELFKSLPPDFQGQLVMQAVSDFAPIGLRIGRGALSTIPVVSLPVSTPTNTTATETTNRTSSTRSRTTTTSTAPTTSGTTSTVRPTTTATTTTQRPHTTPAIVVPSGMPNAGLPLSDIVSDGALFWFQDPRAIRSEAKTYFGWITSTGDVEMGSYNHDTKVFDKAILHPNMQVDDHGAPAIIIRPDGRIMAFYTPHDLSASSPLYYRTSTNPRDISSWGPERTIPTNSAGPWAFAYPTAIQLSSQDNKIYLFWRGADLLEQFSTSSDGGASWTPHTQLISVPVQWQRPYFKYESNGSDTIHFAFTDGHPNEVANNNIYYAYYRSGSFYKADGSLIKTESQLPLQFGEVDKVYDAAANGGGSWIWDIALTSDGRPVMVYASFQNISDHTYHYAVWNGSKWLDHEITQAGPSFAGPTEIHYSGGITLDHNNPGIVYLSKEINTSHEIEKWVTNNEGVTWTSVAITSGSAQDNIRPMVPRGHVPGELDVLWAYGSSIGYRDYHTSIRVVGEPVFPDLRECQTLFTCQVRNYLIRQTAQKPTLNWAQDSRPPWQAR